jgi:hypothetical protein
MRGFLCVKFLDDKKKTKVAHVRLTPDEFARLQARAEASDESISHLIRRFIRNEITCVTFEHNVDKVDLRPAKNSRLG